LGFALAPEFAIGEFQKIAEYNIGEESEMMEQMHCGFVECNIGQTGHFTDHLETARISSESRVGIVTPARKSGVSSGKPLRSCSRNSWGFWLPAVEMAIQRSLR